MRIRGENIIMAKWLIPFNAKKIDISSLFENNESLFIKRNRALSEGDEVYIYLSKPFSEVKYKGLVLRSNVTASELPPEYKVSELENGLYAEIKLLLMFPDNKITNEKLKQLGVGQLINQQSIYGKTEQHLIECEKEISVE